MLAKDVPQLYARRIRARVLEDAMLSERECLECPEDDAAISMEVRNRLGRIRKATDMALPRLVSAPLDTVPRNEAEICQNEPTSAPASAPSDSGSPELGRGGLCSGSENPPLTGEGARNEREGSDAVIEVDPRTHAAFLGMNEVRRVHPHAALLRREDHRVIHAAARAQSHLSARQRDERLY